MRLLALSLALALVACGNKSKPATTPPNAPEPVVVQPAVIEPTPGATPSDAELDTLFGHSLDFFDELGSPGGASKVGKTEMDVEPAKSLPPQAHDE